MSRARLARGALLRGPVYGALFGMAAGAVYLWLALAVSGTWAAFGGEDNDGFAGIVYAFAAGLSAAPFGAAIGGVAGTVAGVGNGIVIAGVLLVRPPPPHRFLRHLLPLAIVVTGVICAWLFQLDRPSRMGPNQADAIFMVVLPTLVAELCTYRAGRRLARWYAAVNGRGEIPAPVLNPGSGG